MSTSRFDARRTYSEELDGSRLRTQADKVMQYMADQQWHRLDLIVSACGGTSASISARLRDLRRARNGGLLVQSRRVGGRGGSYEYRVLPHQDQEDEEHEHQADRPDWERTPTTDEQEWSREQAERWGVQ